MRLRRAAALLPAALALLLVVFVWAAPRAAASSFAAIPLLPIPTVSPTVLASPTPSPTNTPSPTPNPIQITPTGSPSSLPPTATPYTNTTPSPTAVPFDPKLSQLQGDAPQLPAVQVTLNPNPDAEELAIIPTAQDGVDPVAALILGVLGGFALLAGFSTFLLRKLR